MAFIGVLSCPVVCNLRALVAPDDAASLGTVLWHCFPHKEVDFGDGSYYGGAEVMEVADAASAANQPQQKKLPGVTHVFRSERTPIREIRSLSQYMPEIQFRLEYEVTDKEKGEAGRSGLIIFMAGEIVQDECVVDESHADDLAAPIGSWWLRRVAEKMLKSGYDTLLGEVEGGSEPQSKERMSMRCDFSAFEYLQNRLDPGDQRILDAMAASYRVQHDVARRRNKAANLAVEISAFMAVDSHDQSATYRLSQDEVKQLAATVTLLRRAACGVPGTSERV